MTDISLGACWKHSIYAHHSLLHLKPPSIKIPRHDTVSIKVPEAPLASTSQTLLPLTIAHRYAMTCIPSSHSLTEWGQDVIRTLSKAPAFKASLSLR